MHAPALPMPKVQTWHFSLRFLPFFATQLLLLLPNILTKKGGQRQTPTNRGRQKENEEKKKNIKLGVYCPTQYAMTFIGEKSGEIFLVPCLSVCLFSLDCQGPSPLLSRLWRLKSAFLHLVPHSKQYLRADEGVESYKAFLAGSFFAIKISDLFDCLSVGKKNWEILEPSLTMLRRTNLFILTQSIKYS